MVLPFENSDLEQINESIISSGGGGDASASNQVLQIQSSNNILAKSYNQRPTEKAGRTYFNFNSQRTAFVTTIIYANLPIGSTLYITSLGLTAENSSIIQYQEFFLRNNANIIWSDFIGAKVATDSARRLSTQQTFPEPLKCIGANANVDLNQGNPSFPLIYTINVTGYIE